MIGNVFFVSGLADRLRGRAPSREHPPAHLRRRERRGLRLCRRQRADHAGDPGAPPVRRHLPHEHGRLEASHGLLERGCDYLLVHRAGQQRHHSRGHVWPLHERYGVFRAGPEGEKPMRLAATPGYDAEAVYSPNGDRIVFTSMRTGARMTRTAQGPDVGTPVIEKKALHVS